MCTSVARSADPLEPAIDRAYKAVKHIEREIKLALTPQAGARLARLAPSRRSDLARLGLRAMIAGTLAALWLGIASWRLLPVMIAGGGGTIVNIGGVSAHIGAKNRAHVAAAKAGIVGLTKALAVEFADRNVTVNCLAPGKIGGERSKTAGESPKMPAEILLGREGEIDEAAGMVVALCLPQARFMTGQTVHVSGVAIHFGSYGNRPMTVQTEPRPERATLNPHSRASRAMACLSNSARRLRAASVPSRATRVWPRM